MISVRLSLALAAALALTSCASAPPTPTPPTAAAAGAAAVVATTPKLLLVSIDGLRADMLDRGITPNLSRIAHDGVRARWMTPSYPSLTFPNHYTLVTGLRPNHHGIIHNSMQEEALGRFQVNLPEAVTDSRWWGGEPIWVGAEKAGLRSATWSWPGSEAAIQGVRPSQWRVYSPDVPLADRVDDVLRWVGDDGPDAPRLVTLYMEQVDKAGHHYGPDSPEYAAAIVQVDTAIGRLLDGLAARGLDDSTNLIVVSDHGMAQVPDGQTIAVEDMVDPTIASNVSTGQSIGFAPLPGKQPAAEAILLGAHANYDCWTRQTLPARWEYGSNPRIPPIICQMHEGWNALTRERLAERKPGDRGSHGYDNALPSMRAIFIARGPSFKQGATLPGFDNVDLYPLMTRLLGIPAAPNDGNPETLVPALK
ncbi:putative AlkP superfamily pyrophosphatase or phosphodiesterase [Stenotrophomonas rhizophila]|uniref:AlkP superfamily pyrophosphatase or phosphodiesterase n=1 Tax=Stenotrophomonas rhizophila TaxID=216778 RepID=A0AAP5EF08_9GAMM|nr:ectonucleotide pyrophosphatase/phosphodiesterase [Stenotrophomonas rhizophila]MDQ1109263.1 putative AlkP superfamily pyrophosphatase or phosphodiesterase [Stenotrophomonas rhizophila]